MPHFQDDFDTEVKKVSRIKDEKELAADKLLFNH